MVNLKHLNKSVHSIIDSSNEERILKVNSDVWIGYTRAKSILSQLDMLMKMPRRSRMPNVLIVGRSNNGKSKILERFEKLNPVETNVQSDFVSLPVFYMQSPPVPDEHRLYNTILEKLFAPFRPNESAAKKQSHVVNLMKELKVKILVIDEIHNLLAGSLTRTGQFLTAYKIQVS